MKALTFLGATAAWETKYIMPDGRKCTAPYFGVALARFYPQLTCMKVFVTERAKKSICNASKPCRRPRGCIGFRQNS